MSLIRHGPIDAQCCSVYYFDRVSNKICVSSFNEFIKKQEEFGIPNHRIRAIVSTKNGITKILFRRSDYNPPLSD